MKFSFLYFVILVVALLITLALSTALVFGLSILLPTVIAFNWQTVAAVYFLIVVIRALL